MDTETFMKTAHLLLGLTRHEFERRMNSGLIDPQILMAQMEQHSQEMQLEAMCEKWIELRSLEQVDKFSNNE